MGLTKDASCLLPDLVSDRARNDPHALFARVPVGPAYSNGFQDVTYAQLNNAVNFIASLLVRTYCESKNFETLAYVGSTDVRYPFMVLAGMKVGYKVFLPSPRNSVEAQVTLLTGLQCVKLVVTEPQAPCIPAILKELELQTLVLPSLEYLLGVGNVEDVPFEKSFAEAKNDPIFVLHTSGSTGIPKPLIYTNEWISKLIRSCHLPVIDGKIDSINYISTGTVFITLPLFHMGGVGLALLFALYCELVPVYPIPGPPPTTEALVDAISNTKVDWAIVPPIFVDELGKRQDLLDIAASRLKYILYAGGSLPKASGDIVAQKLLLRTALGSSEAGIIPMIHDVNDYNASKDWVYMQFNPALKHEMRHQHEDLYEMVLIRNADTEIFQPVFTHFPDAKEFPTRDLFRPHPLKEGLWLYHSRIDDIIVFLHGEKTNPISFEHQITAHPEIKAALVVGAQRVEAALLVELFTDVELTDPEKATLIERIWPVVEKANKATPAHARVARNRILFVNPKMPMARASKGTVQRAATLAIYAAEIEKLYQQEEIPEKLQARHSPEKELKSLVRDAVAEMLPIDDLDFFQLGMDSLGVLRLKRALKRHFPGADIANNIVYSNSSVNALVKELEQLVVTTQTTNAAAVDESSRTDEEQDGIVTNNVAANGVTPSTEELSKMLEAYSREVSAISGEEGLPAPKTHVKDAVILLTGSTGALGSYVLDNLLAKLEVTQVYCLNRTADAQERQTKTNESRGLDTNFSPERVIFLNGDLTKPAFGLPSNTYKELVERVTHIVHNAWPVNFNLPLASFAPSVAGVVSLIRFAAQSKRHSSIQFFSSISSVLNHPDAVVPEAIDYNLTTPSSGGYGQSKYLAGRLLDHACKTLDIHASTVHIGQVAGAARTASGWNGQEWLPSLVTSSASMGVLPATLGDDADTVNWVPVDHLAGVLVELALASKSTEYERHGVTVHQIVHPQPVTWTSILPIVKRVIEESHSLKDPIRVVPYGEWLLVLKAKSVEAEKNTDADYAKLVQRTPGMKLIDFYEGLQSGGTRGTNPTFSIEKTSKISSTLAKLEPLQDCWIEGWVKEWLEAVMIS